MNTFCTEKEAAWENFLFLWEIYRFTTVTTFKSQSSSLFSGISLYCILDKKANNSNNNNKKNSLFRQMDIHHFLQIIRDSCLSLKCRKSQWRLLNRPWIFFWSNEKVLKLQRHGDCIWHCECATWHWIVHCKIVHSMLCEFHLS